MNSPFRFPSCRKRPLRFLHLCQVSHKDSSNFHYSERIPFFMLSRIILLPPHCCRSFFFSPFSRRNFLTGSFFLGDFQATSSPSQIVCRRLVQRLSLEFLVRPRMFPGLPGRGGFISTESGNSCPSRSRPICNLNFKHSAVSP